MKEKPDLFKEPRDLQEAVLIQKELERRAKERMSNNWKVIHLGETGGSDTLAEDISSQTGLATTAVKELTVRVDKEDSVAKVKFGRLQSSFEGNVSNFTTSTKANSNEQFLRQLSVSKSEAVIGLKLTEVPSFEKYKVKPVQPSWGHAGARIPVEKIV